MKKILIVDDDKELRSHLLDIVSLESGFSAETAENGEEAIKKTIDQDYDLILLDLMMPRMNGADVLRELRKASPRSRVMMMTAFATIENAVEAIKHGASDYIIKPFKIEDLLTRMRRVLEEATFESCATGDLDAILGALSNSIRRTALHLVSVHRSLRLMELARILEIEDHTKLIFHLKILRQAGFLTQDPEKNYVLSQEGEKAVSCLRILENHLSR